MAPNALDESIEAAKFAKICKLNHKIITVTWENYKNNIEFLCKKFNRPLHPIEIALYLTSKQAKKDGIDYLVSGCGADSNFGGIDKLLSVNWTYEDFKKRYTFVPPEKVLKPQYIQSIDYVFKKYKINNSIDVFQFVEAIMGQEHSLYFDNPINLGGCKLLAPHNMLKFSTPLDLNRIKNGEPKYILRNIFKQLFPNIEIPKKIAFARPMDSWMQFYIKSNRPEYLDNLDLNQFTGEQKWLIYCLEQYLNYKDKND